MANLSVEKLATVIGSEPELLLSQIQEAGLSHSKVSDEVTDADKKILLDFLKNQQSTTSKTISLDLICKICSILASILGQSIYCP